ncbi:DNA ligase 1-like [Helianthus annuus]|uniref:DNA ligase 1-like n=1 Tax=Helianthus annuus TaxID=4232 RepID=UPI000B8FDDFF|nr:DNA ligase 1-like [Helianthus annuus]
MQTEATDYVLTEFMGERKSTPHASPINPTIHIHDDPKKSPKEQPKKATTSSSSHGFPKVIGEYPEDLPKGDFDIFNEGKINVLTKKVSVLEKAKAKAEVEREEFKEKLEAAKAENVALKKDLEDHAEVIDKLSEDLEEHAKVIDRITAEFDEVNVKYETVNEANKMLHQMIGELHETTSNENEVLRKEIEALRADKVVKDEQLNMLYTRVETRRAEREKQLAEEAKQKKKDVTPEEIKLSRRKIIEKRREEEEKEEEEDPELKDWFDAIDSYDANDDDDDDDQGATGLIIVKPSVQHTLDDFLNDQLNEQQEDQHHEASSSSKQHAGDQVYLTLPKVIYLHAEVEGELEEIRTRESMLEELGMDDGHMKFDIKDEIPPSPKREYSFKFVNEADNFKDMIIEEGSDVSDEDTPFHYSGVDDTFPKFNELFQSHNKDEVRRKIVERITTEGVPETVSEENLLEERKKWFKVMPKERKYKTPLQYFTDHPDKSLGDILSWGYLEKLKVYVIRREHGVQYFEFLSDIKTLPWWDVEELMQMKNIKQFYYGLDVKMHD